MATGEFLLYASEDGVTKLEVRLVDETVWLSQKQMADLFQKDVRTINEHIRNVISEGELEADSVIRNFRITAADGKSYDVAHYNLDVIISVGYRVKSHRGTQFRIWATQRLREYLIKGFVLNDERLKRAGGGNYFDELLARIRDIRSSEKVFWRKVLDIYATSIDYDPSAEASQRFFATVQNKMHWAAHGHTAAEIVHRRADAAQPNMGLTSWAGEKPRKADAAIAKNYLAADELETLNRIVNVYLEFAELQAVSRRPMYMADWIGKLDEFLRVSEREVLDHAGTSPTSSRCKRPKSSSRNTGSSFERSEPRGAALRGSGEKAEAVGAGEAEAGRQGAGGEEMTWPKKPLGEVATLQRGFDLPAEQRSDGPYPVVSSGGVTGKHSVAMVSGPGVVTGRYGSVGEVYFVPEDFWPLNTTLWVKSFHGNDRKFVYHLLKGFNFAKFSDKTGIPGVNRNDLHKVPVTVPPIEIQSQIVAILDLWDASIEKTERLIAAKERHMEALIGRLYAHSHREGQVLPFRAFLVESSIVGASGRHAKKLSIKLYGKGIVAKDEKRLGSEQTQYFVRRAGQLVYSKLDFLNGAFGIIPPELDGYESTLDLPAFDIAPTIDSTWLLGYLTRPSYYTRQVGLARGQRKARRVHPSDFLASTLRVPPLDLQRQIANVLKAAREEIETTTDLLEMFKVQKRGLMQKLLTGQWRIPVREGELSHASVG